jgi:hypothetical protein
MGPVEVLVVGFPGNRFNGKIVPEIQSLVERGIISVIDGVLVRKDIDGTVTFIEFEEEGADDDVAALSALIDEMEDLVSAEDLDELSAGREPNTSAAVLVFEHTWATGLKNALSDAGGVLVADVRVPALVVDEVLAAIRDAGQS